jgi:hypothetical protein
VEGMYKYLNLGKEIVERIFPCIDQLIDIHFRFLEELRIRQNEQPVMSSLSDILLRQFSGNWPVIRGCQISFRTIYQNGKSTQNLPNGHIIEKITTKYTEWT